MAKIRIVIGNLEMDSDGSPESQKVVHELVTSLFNVALEPQPKPRRVRNSKKQTIESK
jgi:hypothetical protein